MKEAGIVVVSESEVGKALSETMTHHGFSAICCTNLGQVIRNHSIGSLSVLVLHLDAYRNGSPLAAVGRMAVEHPRLQKVAIAEGPLSLPVTSYLTACAVELIRKRLERANLEEIASLVGEAWERQSWSLAVRAI